MHPLTTKTVSENKMVDDKYQSKRKKKLLKLKKAIERAMRAVERHLEKTRKKCGRS